MSFRVFAPQRGLLCLTEPLRRLLARAKTWGVDLPNNIEWKKFMLKEPQERVYNNNNNKYERCDERLTRSQHQA